MVEGEFESSEGTEPVGFSHSDFGLVVQTLDYTAGEQFLGPKIVQDQFAMLTQRASDLLHRLDAGPHDLAAPFIEELSRPDRGVVIPELLESFFEKISGDGLQVVAKQIA